MARSKALMDYLAFFYLLLLFQICTQFVASDHHSVVKFLPGFEGPLPFHLETGYVGVGESEEVQLFYYFVKSTRNASEDPLLLWLTGGPCCSALSAFLFEIGPLRFEVKEYDGSIPTLVLDPNSWTQVSSIIFVDMPAGTGLSYARTTLASNVGDFIQVHQGDQFLRKWLIDHPEFLSNKVYVGGDSYSGLIVPALVQQISNGNEQDITPQISLKGYILGNPTTDKNIDTSSAIPFAHGMGLISDELFESLKRSCGGQYQSLDPTNGKCSKYLKDYSKSISGINVAHILEPLCAFVSPKPIEIIGRRRSLINNNSVEFLNFDQELPTVGCRTYTYLLSIYWMNNVAVQKALHVRDGSIKRWVRCNYGLNYTREIDSSIKYHANLSKKGYPALVYSGDHDMLVPFVGTQAWIRSLNYSIIDDWRPWYLQGQVAGYTRTYSNGMTFATIKGGGHTAPEYTPTECFALFRKWMGGEPL